MTDAELAVLSIIAEAPIHGHAIHTVIDRRGLRAWTNIGVSSLYYVIEKLERQGLIASDEESASQSVRYREFRITAAGFGVLQTAVADLLSTPHDFFDGFELGLSNLHVLRPAQIRAALTAYQHELAARLAQTRELWRQLQGGPTPFNVDAMLGHHAAMLEAELDWITGFITQWESQAPPDELAAAAEEPAEVPRMQQVVLPHHPDSVHRAETRAHDAHRHDGVTSDPAADSEPSTRPTRRDTAMPSPIVSPPLDDDHTPGDFPAHDGEPPADPG